jgi:tRNA G10  N-methylase Trm11
MSTEYNYNNHPGSQVLSAIRTGHVEKSGSKVTQKGLDALVDYCETYNVDLPQGYEKYATPKPAVEEPAGFLDKFKDTVSNVAGSIKDKVSGIELGSASESGERPKYDIDKGLAGISSVNTGGDGPSLSDAIMQKYGQTNVQKAAEQQQPTVNNEQAVSDASYAGYDAFTGVDTSKVNIEEHQDASPAFKNAAMAYNAEISYADKLKNSYAFNRLNISYAREANKAMNGQDNSMVEIKAQVEAYAQLHPEIFDQEDVGLLGQMGLATAEMLPFMAETTKSGFEKGLAGAIGFGTAAGTIGQMGPQVMTPEEIYTVPGAAAAGFKIGSTMGSAMTSYEVESGFAYADMIEQGIDPELASTIANYVGLANAGIEVVQLGTIMKKMPVVGKLLRTGLNEGAEEIAQKYIRNNTGKTILSGLKEYSKDIASEVGEEVAQEVVTMTGEITAQKISGNEAKILTAEHGNRLLQTAVQTLKAMPIIVGPGNVMQTGSTLNKDYKIKKTEGELTKNISEVLAVNSVLPGNIGTDANKEFIIQLQEVAKKTDVKNIETIALDGIDKVNVSQLTSYGREIHDVVRDNDINLISDELIEMQEAGQLIIDEFKADESKAETYKKDIYLFEGILKSLDDMVVDNKKVETSPEIETAINNAEKKRKQEALELSETASAVIEEATVEEETEKKAAEGWINTKKYGDIQVVDDTDPSKVKVKTSGGAELEIGRKLFEKMTGKKVADVKAKETNTKTVDTLVSEREKLVKKLEKHQKQNNHEKLGETSSELESLDDSIASGIENELGDYTVESLKVKRKELLKDKETANPDKLAYIDKMIKHIDARLDILNKKNTTKVDETSTLDELDAERKELLKDLINYTVVRDKENIAETNKRIDELDDLIAKKVQEEIDARPEENSVTEFENDEKYLAKKEEGKTKAKELFDKMVEEGSKVINAFKKITKNSINDAKVTKTKKGNGFELKFDGNPHSLIKSVLRQNGYAQYSGTKLYIPENLRGVNVVPEVGHTYEAVDLVWRGDDERVADLAIRLNDVDFKQTGKLGTDKHFSEQTYEELLLTREIYRGKLVYWMTNGRENKSIMKLGNQGVLALDGLVTDDLKQKIAVADLAISDYSKETNKEESTSKTENEGAKELPEPKAKENPYTSYQDAQNSIDDFEDELSEKYGEKEFVDKLINSELEPEEQSKMDSLVDFRDEFERNENDELVNTILGKLTFEEDSNEWIVGRRVVENSLRRMLKTQKSSIVWGEQNKVNIHKDLYNDFIQGTDAPSELWGEYDYAVSLANDNENSPFGKSLKPLMKQIDDVVNAIVEVTSGQVEETNKVKELTETKKETEELNTKFGRAGNAAFKKWSGNEYINADINNLESEYTQNWIKLFNKYYDRGLSGERIYTTMEQGELEIEFPPFVLDEIYKAGKKDKAAKDKKEVKKEEKADANLNTDSESDIIEAKKGPHKYYLTQRPPSMGTHPKGTTKVVAFDQRQFVDEIGREAWGYVEYDKELSDKDIDDYELMGVKPQKEESSKDVNKYQQLADIVLEKLRAKEKVNISNLYKSANDIFGGTMSDNVYNIKDLYDAMELAVNQYILEFGGYEFTSNIDDAKLVLQHIEFMLDKIPTQTKRTDDMVKLQQFSTPPNIAYVVNWLANITTNDKVLEPSAGTGSLAIWGKKAGAEVYVNEISDRRNEVLHQLPFDRYFTENAEQINNILPADVKPSVVVMNPPFSATTRMSKNATANAKKHIEQALKRLEPNGRLIVLTGNGMAEQKKSFYAWWKEIKAEYDVKANVTVDGKNYKKYGTQYDIQLIVIDKIGPTTERTKTGTYQNLNKLIDDLGGIRDERRIPTNDAQKINEGNGSPNESGSNEDVQGRNDLESGSTSANSDGISNGKTDDSDNGRNGSNVGSRKNDGSISETGQRGNGVDDGRAADVQDQGRNDGTIDKSPTKSDGRSGNATKGKGVVGKESEIKTTNKKKKNKKTSSKDLTESIFENYVPVKLKIEGAKDHPSVLAESAAMSAVDPPDVTYAPSIDKKLIKTGALSLPQLEAIVYAGQAHLQMLKDGIRKGFFIGDGTGVGKGREITGIILDNFAKGRKKAVWITPNQGLFDDAARDLNDLNYPSNVIKISDNKKGTKITETEGVLLTTYGTLSDQYKKEVSLEEGKYSNPQFAERNRIKQLYDWLGPDYDGVIAFDEAHKMKTAVPPKGTRGKTKASDIGGTGLILNELFPKARIVYVSATGATEVSNLGYAQRLGLWGGDTNFETVHEFIEELEKGGIPAMELVARDMKAMGVYIARALSYDGVQYGRKEHKLTNTQNKVYDKMAEAWGIVLDNVYAAIEETEGGSSQKSSALSAFWGYNQRFFNQIVTSFKMPTIIAEAKEQLEKGNSVVLQTIGTFEASTNRKIAKAYEGMDLDDLDLSPRDMLINYLEKSFPVTQYEPIEDEHGNIRMQPVKDSKGNDVVNPESVARRDKLIEDLATLPVPEDPLTMLYDELGYENIAEVSGRKRQVVSVVDEYGNKKRELRKRGKNASKNDADQFNSGRKRILLFTKAGGTGFSFHASLKFKNQEKRVHILMEGGYSADDAIQGFGRTHRSFERIPPYYLLVTTNIAGEKRFISTIAKRLDQLGALTKGQRQTGSTGVFNATDNIESDYAKDALHQLYKDLANDRVAGFEKEETFKKLGMSNMLDENGNIPESGDDLRKISKFLNRVLATPVSFQNKLFQEFESRMDTFIERALKDGTFDKGMENLKADSVEVESKIVAKTYPGMDATTDYVKLKTGSVVKKIAFEEIDHEQKKFMGFYVNKISGNVRAVFRTGIVKTDGNGNQVERIKIQGQADYQNTVAGKTEFEANENWSELKDKDKAESIWKEGLNSVPEMKYKEVHMITGALLPIWKRLPTSKFKIMRTVTDSGEQFLGRVVREKELNLTLKALDVDVTENRTNTQKEQVNIKDALQDIMDTGNFLMFKRNGWRVTKKRVSNENRLELIGDDIYKHEANLKKMGIFKEMIQYRARYFIPTNTAVDITQKLVDKYGFKGMTSKVDNTNSFNKVESNTFNNLVNSSKDITEVKKDVATYEKARSGNLNAAVRLVDQNIDKDSMKQLAVKYPHAYIAPVIDADNINNSIPVAYSNAVSKYSGLELDLNIIKENSHKDSKMSAIERIADKPIFTGLVVPGREYIITDDVFTMGSTINEMKKFIEDNGGIVVDVVTLSQSKNGNNLNVTEDTKTMLNEKFGMAALETELKERGVIDESINELTEGEAKQLQKLKNIDAIRTKFTSKQVDKELGNSEKVKQDEIRNNYGSSGKSVFHSVIEGIVAGDKKKKIKSFNRMISELASHFKLPVDTRGFRKRKATGYYELVPKTVRIKFDNDIEVVMHEIGHHLDSKYDLQESNDVAVEEMVDNLPDDFKKNYKENLLPGEAIAEFFKMYIVDPKAAETFGSQFYDIFEGLLDKTDLKAVQKTQKDMSDFTKASRTEMFGSTIVSHTENSDGRNFKDKAKYLKMRLYALLFEGNLGLANLSRFAEKINGESLKPSNDPSGLAGRTLKAQSIASGMLGGVKSGIKTGLSDPYSNIIDGKTFIDVLKDVVENEEKFVIYLKNKHAYDLMRIGHRVYSPQLTLDMVKEEVEAMEELHPEFKETAEELYQWWNKFMKAWMVDTGFISKESWEKMLEKYPHYVPMLRVNEGYTIGPNGDFIKVRNKSSIGNQSAPINRLSQSGNGMNTYNPLESMITQVFKIVDAQLKREVMLSMHDLHQKGADGVGEFYHKINRPMEYHSYDAREMKTSMAIGFLNDYFTKTYGLQLTDKHLSSLLFGTERTKKKVSEQLMSEGVDMENVDKILDGVKDYITENFDEDTEIHEVLEDFLDGDYSPIDIMERYVDDTIEWFTASSYSKDSEVLTVIDRDNKVHFYKINDIFLHEALAGMSPVQVDSVFKALIKLRVMFTNVITSKNIIFGLLSNLPRDIPTGFIQGHENNPVKYAYGLGKSFKSVITHDEKNQEYRTVGGGFGTRMSGNQKNMMKEVRSQFGFEKEGKMHKVLQAIEHFNDAIESAPRQVEFYKIYDKKIAEGWSHHDATMEALYESGDVTLNFLRKGLIMNYPIAQVVPFLNAGLQGLDKLGRMAQNKETRKEAITKGILTLTLPTLALAWHYRDDDDYKKIAKNIRDNYWLIKIPGTNMFWRTPKPRELAFIFSTLEDRMFRYFAGEDDPFAKLDKTFLNVFVPPVKPVGWAIAEVAMNKSWTGAPIVPYNLAAKPVDYQYDDKTSRLAVAVAKVIPNALGVYSSPKNIDYMIDQLTGIIGDVILPMTTPSEDPLKKILLNRITADPIYSNDSINDFYEIKEKLNEAKNVYDSDGIKTKDYNPSIQNKFKFNYSRINKYWDMIRAAEKNSGYTVAEKEGLIRDYRKSIIDLADDALEYYKENKR